MDMIGLKSVKREALNLYQSICTYVMEAHESQHKNTRRYYALDCMYAIYNFGFSVMLK